MLSGTTACGREGVLTKKKKNKATDQGNLLRDISHRQLASDNQTSQNHRVMVSMLETLRSKNRFVFRETFGAIRDLDRSNQEGSEEIRDLVRAGQKAESGCCNKTKSMIRDLEKLRGT